MGVGAGLIAACLALLIWSAAVPAAPRSPGAAPAARAVPAAATGPGSPVLAAPALVRVTARRDTLAACEAQLERAPGGIPRMAVVGASFTAGVGPGSAALSWAVLLARALRWNAVVYGVPGAGYAHAGSGRRGPVARMLAKIDLRALTPSLVVVQAGHDDSGVPAPLERQRVTQVITAIRAATPSARIALLTVFGGPSRATRALYRTNDAIIAAGVAADPDVIIMNPLGDGWHFARTHDGLHPTAAGDAWIAGTVAAILRAHGVLPAAGRTPAAPVICDSGLGSGARTGTEPRFPRFQ
jgi:lysophospholipase L1-like esterase